MKLKHLPYTPIRITSRFGPRNTGIAGASTNHKGINLGRDLVKYPSTATTDAGPVFAALPGKVVTSAYDSARGYYVILDHGTMDGVNVRTLYQHLVAGSNIAEGRTVKSGDTVGRMEVTGVSAGIHLHFEVQLNNKPVNPEPYLYDIDEEEEMTKDEVKAIVRELLNESGAQPSSWAKSEWEKAKAAGITDGTKPQAVPTREQVASMIVRAVGD